MWREEDILLNRVGKMERDTFEHILRSSAAVLRADVLIDTTLEALARQQEPRNRLHVPTVPLSGQAESEGVAVVGESRASQPANLIYFPKVTRRRRARHGSVLRDVQSVRAGSRAGDVPAPLRHHANP